MGTVYFIRHGQRFPVKDFSHTKSVFGDEPVVFGELTEIGRTRMRQLGAEFKGVPIVKARFSGIRRCEDSLSEFLKGAESPALVEHLGDTNFTGFKDFVEKCDKTAVTHALKTCIRNRKALNEIEEKYLGGLEEGFIRDVAAGAVVDSLAILDDREIQKMSTDEAELDLDYAIAMSLGLRNCFGDAIRKTIFDGFDNRDGHTVTVASDVHLLYILQRVAPRLINKRPPFGSVLKLTPSDGIVHLQYLNQEIEISFAEFQREMGRDDFDFRIKTV